MNPKALDELARVIKDVHAAAVIWKADSWNLYEELMREKEDLQRILKWMEAQGPEKVNR